MEAMTITPQLAQSLLDQHPEVPALLAQAGLRMPRAGEPLKLSHEQYHRFLKVLDISAHEETLLTYGDITALHGPCGGQLNLTAPARASVLATMDTPGFCLPAG